MGPASHRAVGAALQDRGDLQGAIREYQIALHARDPKLLDYTYANLGIIYRQLGNDAAARQNSDLALRSDPGTVRQMIQQLSGVVQARPTAPGYLRLGLLLEGAGQSRMQSQPSRALCNWTRVSHQPAKLCRIFWHNDPDLRFS
jgi:tetratricopeptide (TPR) repeat protein